ncbi:16S rRNA (guanine(527)-N(7))-methyltransferase RsmG [Leptolyngbya sp. AN02str]|uniref:16S rRNA (guanine(527)-N(7))-methyltransferase RsmG n=1 Tax=Leptolyngbya sp. AN02str TaxID=3423363 RepID=UPI003D31F5B5
MAHPSAPALPVLLDCWQSTLGWRPTDVQQAQFQALYEQILVANRSLNLTRITEPEEFWEKHLWDSLSGVQWMLANPAEVASSRLIDIGTGAGFPGVPVAIALPQLSVTLMDSTRKKILFLDGFIEQLPLPNAQTVSDRVEALGQDPHHREQYDLATLRAVAAANVCAEYALPLVAVGGHAVLYRGQWTPEEEKKLAIAAKSLGGAIAQVEQFSTPLSHSIRTCIHLQKVAPTPSEFPRGVGVPSQKPLGG